MPDFSRPTETVSFAGILSDFDGTIIDSTDAIVKYWRLIGHELGVDYEEMIKSAHGRRSIDTLKQYEPSKANWEYVSRMEGLIPKRFGQDAVEIPGARNLLSTLDAVDAPWAIVTSGTRPLIEGWLEVMQLARPQRLVTAEDVAQGKPDPECYLLGKSRLRLPANASGDMIVIEDAPAGIKAGKSAGCKVVGLATSHDIELVRKAGADWIVKDLESVQCGRSDLDGSLTLRISNALNL